ncbi:polysaccharide deacetylase family protein [Blastococcus capsensis]|uniref:polysaccharide deacetylase family protein n=1 Tax=Blastococcus capsensis TaxID=1564163 RepID=UPI00253FC9D7|nr:polysaccharide deacetylase family protein [Blastococcus capsensis]MDK3256760.1 polysaccharide deacetylase family protein [Blastococcus capsensis]
MNRERLAGIRSRLPGGRAAAALTFDDGPDPRFTPAVLDVLADHGVVATFFLVGRRAERHPGLVSRILRDGHAIGSHSWSHPDPSGQSFPRLLREYRRGRRAVEAAAGAPVRLFRPPMGDVALPSTAAAALSGVRPWLWTRDPRDWLPGRTTADILGAVPALEAGDVVLLHDGIELPVSDEALDRSATVAAVPALVRRAEAAGLALVTLPSGRAPRS